MKRLLCAGRPEKAITPPPPPPLSQNASPVILLLAADLKAVVEREGLVALPVGQLHPQGVLPLAAQLVDVLVPQPVLRGHAPETLRRRRTETRVRRKQGKTKKPCRSSTQRRFTQENAVTKGNNSQDRAAGEERLGLILVYFFLFYSHSVLSWTNPLSGLS